MKKINTCLGCPKCTASGNTEHSLEFHNEQIKYDAHDDAKIITRQKVYNCRCNNCGHDYIVDHGSEKYVLFNKPLLTNCLGDVKLLVIYDTESGFENSYKICSITPSPYNENVVSKEPIYLMFVEGEEFPILLSKHTVDKIIEDRNIASIIISNHLQARNR